MSAMILSILGRDFPNDIDPLRIPIDDHLDERIAQVVAAALPPTAPRPWAARGLFCVQDVGSSRSVSLPLDARVREIPAQLPGAGDKRVTFAEARGGRGS